MYHREIQTKTRYCDGTVDKTDLKSVGGNTVGVRIPSVAPGFVLLFLAKRKDA